MTCKHKHFTATVNVNRLEDTGRFNADVRISCTQCNAPFRFLGLPAGLDPNGAAVSVDGTEARLAIGTPETVANIMDGVDPVGFTVRRKQPHCTDRGCSAEELEALRSLFQQVQFVLACCPPMTPQQEDLWPELKMRAERVAKEMTA